MLPNDADVSDIELRWDGDVLIPNNTVDNMEIFVDKDTVALSEPEIPLRNAAPNSALQAESDIEATQKVLTYEFLIADDNVYSIEGFPNGELVTLTPDENGKYIITLKPAA